MDIGSHRRLFIVIGLCLALIVVSSLLAIMVPSEDNPEPISEIWLLDSNHAADNYPYNVTADETYNIFVDVVNHMGGPETYRVYVKFGNSSQLSFNASEPNSLTPLYDFQFLVDDEESYEFPLSFAFPNLSLVTDVTANASDIENPILSINEIEINGVVFPVDTYTSWDAETGGFDVRLSFELWRYDAVSDSFVFHDRVVGLILNITNS